MVRRLGVSHKSLLVPNVGAGTYSIRYEHADYLDRDFNITVGSGLPTTFSEAMVEKSYTMAIELPLGTLLTSPTVIAGEPILYNTFRIRNNGNSPAFAWYYLDIVGISGITPSILPNQYTEVTTPPQEGTFPMGPQNNTLSTGPNLTGLVGDNLAATDTHTEVLTIVEWSTDVTFIATAPGISDLHGVHVFIDNVDMGIT